MRVGRRRRWVGVLLVVLVMLMGSAVSASVYDMVKQGEDRYAAQAMDRYADDVASSVTDQVARYGEILVDLAYSVGAQTDLERTDFERITAGLTTARLPGATGVVYLVPATPAQVGATQRFWRGHGGPELTLRPAADVPAHAFIIFEHSFDGVDMRGVDVESSPQAATALHVARHAGSYALSPAYRLLRDRDLPAESRQMSFAIAAPVTAGLGSDAPDVFAGWVMMGIRGQDFLSRTMLQQAHGAVQVSLDDPLVPGAPIAAVAPGTRVDDGSLTRGRTLIIGGRRLTVTVRPTTRLMAVTDQGMSRLTLITGAALTVMLGLLTAVLVGSRNHALDRVDLATAELREDIQRRERIEAELREREEQLEHLAGHDPLTGLANRAPFHLKVGAALAAHDRDGRGCAVLFVDLDGFKQINDRYGHSAGDTVLATVAERLRRGSRAGDLPARLGGDEFAVLLDGITTADDARAAADRLIASVREPIGIGEVQVSVGASVGIALPAVGSTADDLIRDADAAMYAAKAAGKNRYAEA